LVVIINMTEAASKSMVSTITSLCFPPQVLFGAPQKDRGMDEVSCHFVPQNQTLSI
jgi:hypothetical protein